MRVGEGICATKGMNIHSCPYKAIESNDSNSVPRAFFQFFY